MFIILLKNMEHRMVDNTGSFSMASICKDCGLVLVYLKDEFSCDNYWFRLEGSEFKYYESEPDCK